MEQLIRLNMNFLFGDTIRKKIDYQHELKTERLMETENDNKNEEYQKLKNGGFIVEIENDDGIDDDETSKINRRPSHSGAFILNNSKRIMNHFIILDGT